MLGLSQKEKNESLKEAISRADAAAVVKALNKGAAPDRQPGECGGPLVNACRLKSEGASLAIVTALLEKGGNVNKGDDDGETVLHYFLKSQPSHLIVLQKLIDSGANLAASYGGTTPLWAAVSNRAWAATELMLKCQPELARTAIKGETLLTQAIDRGAPVSLLEKLMEKPIDINAGGRFALHCAVADKRLEALGYLLKQPGIDLNVVGEDGKTPFLAALVAGFKDIAITLLKAGADPNKPDRDGLTPLLVAARNNDLPLLEALLDAGAAPARGDLAGVNPITAAAAAGSAGMVAALLAAVTQAGLKPDLGPSLLAAAEKGATPVIEQLLAAGANPNAADEDGRTALMKAARADDTAALAVLVAAGAKPEIADKQGLQAYDHAVSGGRMANKDFLFRRRGLASPSLAEEPRYTLLNRHSLEVRESENLSVIFNFWMQQVIFRDPSQPSPPVVQGFADVPRQEAIEEAFQKLKALGGSPPELQSGALQKNSAGTPPTKAIGTIPKQASGLGKG